MNKNLLKYICALSMGLAPTLTTAQSVNFDSIAAGGQNGMGAAMSGMEAARLSGESAGHFGRCPPHNQGECMQGALKALQALLSMMQMGAHGATAAGAAYSANLTDGNPYDPVTDGPNNPDNPSNPLLTDADFRALKDNMAKLQKGIAGSKLDIKKGTVTMANGLTLSTKDISSPEAMAAAGIPKGAIDGLAAYNAKMGKDLAEKMEKMKLGSMTSASGFDEGGGGGGGGGSFSSEPTARPTAGAGGGDKREPTSMAGMQKNYNGEPIGVAADDIFRMMNRRYKVKESQDSFYSEMDIALQK